MPHLALMDSFLKSALHSTQAQLENLDLPCNMPYWLQDSANMAHLTALHIRMTETQDAIHAGRIMARTQTLRRLSLEASLLSSSRTDDQLLRVMASEAQRTRDSKSCSTLQLVALHIKNMVLHGQENPLHIHTEVSRLEELQLINCVGYNSLLDMSAARPALRRLSIRSCVATDAGRTGKYDGQIIFDLCCGLQELHVRDTNIDFEDADKSGSYVPRLQTLNIDRLASLRSPHPWPDRHPHTFSALSLATRNTELQYLSIMLDSSPAESAVLDEIVVRSEKNIWALT